MLQDIIAEEALVNRMRSILDTIVSKLDRNIETSSNGQGGEAIEPPQWSREPPTDEGPSGREPRLPAPARAVIKGEKPRRPPAVKPPAKPAAVPKSGSQKDLKPPSRPAPPQKVNIGEHEEKPVDPTSNPLAQQIIDMGILVREPNVQWESIAGLAQVKRLLRQNLVILPMRPDLCKGLLAPWKSVLFYGPPGTGKTFLAKAVATECRRTFFNVTSATITSKMYGESEKLVAYLFSLADQMAPATVFFDEIDSIASQRGGGQEHDASRRMKAQLLTKLEGIDSPSDTGTVFVLAATNFPWDLDEALLRRFQKRIYIPLPDIEGRMAILKMTISELVDEDFDLEMWAQKLEGYSCADITNLCKDAAQAVFDKQMSMIDAQAWMNMSADQARVIIRDEDFAKALLLRKSSVDPATLKRYAEWKATKGAE
jgi:katanin p60 ATPase-containing subunit A1